MQDAQKRLSSKAAASEEAKRRTLRYVALLGEARTPLADFFSILLTRDRGIYRHARSGRRPVMKFDLAVTVREKTGKGAARQLRRDGKVPGVLYGAGRMPALDD